MERFVSRAWRCWRGGRKRTAIASDPRRRATLANAGSDWDWNWCGFDSGRLHYRLSESPQHVGTRPWPGAFRRWNVRREDVDEHLTAEPPRRAHEFHHRRERIRGTECAAVRICAVQDNAVHDLWVPHGIDRSRARTARHAETSDFRGFNPAALSRREPPSRRRGRAAAAPCPGHQARGDELPINHLGADTSAHKTAAVTV